MRKLGTILLLAVVILPAGCSEKDPLIGNWRLNDGSTIAFLPQGRVEGMTTDRRTWTGTWTRKDDRIIIDATGSPIFSGHREYQVKKLNDSELMLKSTSDEELIPAVRVSVTK